MAKTGSAVPAWFTTSRCSWSKPGRKTGSDSGGTTAPASPVLNQTRLLTFPGSIATTSVDAGNASCSKPTTASRLLWKRHTDAPAGTGSTAISCGARTATTGRVVAMLGSDLGAASARRRGHRGAPDDGMSPEVAVPASGHQSDSM